MSVKTSTLQSNTVFQYLIRLVFFVFFYFANLPVAHAKPNLILILADDLGYADVFANLPASLQNNNEYQPVKRHNKSISQLATEGVRFTNAYATASTCAPSRAAIMTGKYQQRTGFWDTSDSRVGLHPSQSTLADQLKKAGYESGYFGKWHLGLSPLYNPRQRGFGYFYGFMGHGGHSYYDLTPNRITPFYHNNLLVNFDEINDGRNNYLTDTITDQAVSFIRNQVRNNQPFFAYVSFNAVHTPMHPPMSGPYATTSEVPREKLLAMLGRMDLSIDKILNVLENTGARDNTLIAFMSDNGGAKSNASINTPLSGFKSSYSEGGIRVPLFLSWRGSLQSGEDFEPAVMGFDLFSTFLSAAGAGLPQGEAIDGVDLLPFLRKVDRPAEKKGLVHQWLFWDRNDGGFAVRRKNWVLVKNKNDARASLYDLSKDIAQTTDVAALHPNVTARLNERYLQWRDEMNPRQQFSTERVCRDPRFNNFSNDSTKRHSESKCKNPNYKVGCRDPDASNFDISVYTHEPSLCVF